MRNPTESAIPWSKLRAQMPEGTQERLNEKLHSLVLQWRRDSIDDAVIETNRECVVMRVMARQLEMILEEES